MNYTPNPKKSLGQHWLHDDSVLESICLAGEVSSRDTVLEIGPGTGTLTRKLLERAGKVVAVEKDERLVQELKITFSHELIAKNLQLDSGDILRFDLSTMPLDFKVVANIPYYLTSNLIRTLSETTNQPSLVVLLVQKEVAERVAASAGSMSLLSVSAQFYWNVQLDMVVPARLFTPPPKVDSQILILNRRKAPLYSHGENKLFFRLVKAGFASRRKTLLNSLAGGLRSDKEQIQQVLDTAEISAGLRPQALTLEKWQALYTASLAAGLL